MAESTLSQSDLNTPITNSKPTESLSPITKANRIDAMDILRGFALIGILMMNIEWFNRAISSLASFDTSLTGLDHAAGWLVRCFVEGKFYKLFALLFGMGFAVMLIRARERDRPFGAWFTRRMLVLYAIGLFHMFFLWGGDILHDYAFAGLVFLGWIVLLRKERFKKYDNPRSFLKIGLIWLTVPFIFTAIAGIGFGVYFDNNKLTNHWQEEQQMAVMVSEQEAIIENQASEEPAVKEQAENEEASEVQEAEGNKELTEAEERQQTIDDIIASNKEMAEVNAEEVAAFTQGSYWQATKYRIEFSGLMLLFSPVFTLVMLFPIFLLGYWLISSGIIRNHQDHKAIFKPMAYIGMSLGLLLTIGGLIVMQHPSAVDAKILQGVGNILFAAGQFVMSAGYLGLIIRLLSSDKWHKRLSYLAPMGRMALTNYIMHSVILTTLFYGYAGGFYGQISRAPQMLIVIVIILFQILFSRWWLKQYQFGPLEWLWRCLTYKQYQPMKIQP